MKRFFLVLILIGIGNVAYAQFKVGAHLGYGSYKNIGVGADVEYLLNDKWAAASDFNYYFSTGNGTAWDLNFNGHYYFYEAKQIKAFALTGLNHTRRNVETPKLTNAFGQEFQVEFPTFSSTTINIGIGANYELNDVLEVFSSLKYTISLLGGMNFTVGIKHKF
ncbi:hypothetical protein [Capnocytophaga canis]|uniref:Putative Opacity family porin protein n=1 Tax=Capnocytophaga canis TaxID=1848903 RepID=A0A0B7IDA4_9FLAO|nr:hypothetical protein [Capnocytophaga canis]RIY36150.1 hypothetical protein CKY20_08400 [Capnocytophaga canis]CEN48674.1 putative Opacity family porin protein [Capnocytophaga canis]